MGYVYGVLFIRIYTYISILQDSRYNEMMWLYLTKTSIFLLERRIIHTQLWKEGALPNAAKPSIGPYDSRNRKSKLITSYIYMYLSQDHGNARAQHSSSLQYTPLTQPKEELYSVS